MISQKISQFLKQVAIEHYSSVGHTFDEENETIVFSFLYYPDDYLVFTPDYPKWRIPLNYYVTRITKGKLIKRWPYWKEITWMKIVFEFLEKEMKGCL